jgi:hypothetical protein
MRLPSMRVLGGTFPIFRANQALTADAAMDAEPRLGV